MTLNIDKMNAVLEAIKIFTSNHDTFTLDNVIREIENSVDWYEGDPNDDKEEIGKAVTAIMTTLYPEYRSDFMVAYHYDTKGDNYIEEEIDDLQVDKEGNPIPYPNCDESDDCPTQNYSGGYYKDPATGEWIWDRDAAESERMAEELDWSSTNNEEDNDGADFHDTDHIPTYDIVVDKNKRINIKKAVFKDALWDENEDVTVIGNTQDNAHLYIVRTKDLELFVLNDDEYIVGQYKLKKGALRIGIGSALECVSGDTIHVRANWDDPKCVYIEVFFEW